MYTCADLRGGGGPRGLAQWLWDMVDEFVACWKTLACESLNGAQRVSDQQFDGTGAQWLWDMVDEFVYQFHDFCRFRSKDVKKRTPAELEGLAANPRVWDTMEVRAGIGDGLGRAAARRRGGAAALAEQPAAR